jgi:hypothetical protein
VRQRFLCLISLLILTCGQAVGAPASVDARVTQLLREVSLLPSDAPTRRAILNTVTENMAVKTGGESRAELTFVDLTISRLGANTLYHFKKSGRQVELDAGATLLRVPKGTARLTLVRARDQQRSVASGESLEVPAGAVRLGDPKQVDLAALVKTSPLIVGFRPLPSQNLINNAIRQQQQRGPSNQNQPNRNGPQGPQNNPPPPAPGPR